MSLWTRLRPHLHTITHKGTAHWARMFLLLGMGYVAGHLLSKGEWLTQLRYQVYFEQLKLQHRGQMYPQRTALVMLDDADYWSPEFEARKPIKRDQLAMLLDRLNEAGANTVVVDFDLRSPIAKQPDFDFAGYAAEDAELMAAIGRMCAAGRHVVLAASIREDPVENYFDQMPSIYTKSLPALPCLMPGYIELPADMRRVPGPVDLAEEKHLDSLSLAAVRIADPIAYEEMSRIDEEHGFRFGRFLTQENFATRNGRQFIFNARELRDDDLTQLHSQLADRIVLLSGHWRTFALGQGPYVDMHASPGGNLPGVMLHANYIESMLDRTGTFTPVTDETAEVLEGLLVIILGVIGVLDIHASWKWGAFCGGLLISMLFTYVLLQNLGLFLDFFIPLLMIVVHTLIEEILHMRHQLHAAKHPHPETIHKLP